MEDGVDVGEEEHGKERGHGKGRGCGNRGEVNTGSKNGACGSGEQESGVGQVAVKI